MRWMDPGRRSWMTGPLVPTHGKSSDEGQQLGASEVATAWLGRRSSRLLPHDETWNVACNSRRAT
jgi:hypothetical protein